MRFNVFERFVHWLTAFSFVILGITGLNITFGRVLILPWLGAPAFSDWSEWAKFSHNYVSFAFTVGVVLMFLMWIANNLPTRADLEWFKGGGGMFGGKEPPAYKFNGGEKFIFWLSILGGGLIIASGFVLLFPFYGTTVAGMELAEVVHSVVAVLYRRRHVHPHLHGHHRRGRRLRGDGSRHGGRGVGEGTPQPLVRRGNARHRRRPGPGHAAGRISGFRDSDRKRPALQPGVFAIRGP